MDRFTFLDVLRIIGGLLFFNALLSYWFTSDPTWGYHGKYLNWRFYLHQLHGEQTLTLQQLSQYDGSHGSIFLAINGSVFDVSSNRAVYGPGGGYHQLVGKDAARVYVTGCFLKPDEYTHDLRGLDPEECEKDITGWQRFFHNHKNYWYVGQVKLDYDFQGEPPEPCKHVKFPLS
ncbi:conserved hypothetical protein [Lodderomyces elongisporus NRRL YB-4239]|uniref:Cytochrome b5 heme-binding domain-containing protein n=1 Tax=Lodderomyces elongisporus (strain ATCC 11503 / CBS 2605 / JCM 1781 / NBRC 1676 / NRRL YB-4239) TaxID=379508 RepID=A5DVF0_LODEL|nr:conserved hypothetical protein [Lodderomyces elongisporus NRRL YB-4239]